MQSLPNPDDPVERIDGVGCAGTGSGVAAQEIIQFIIISDDCELV